MRAVRFITAGVLIAVSAWAPAGTLLREIRTHLAYARKCLDSADHEGLRASTELLKLERIQVYIPEGASTKSKVALEEAMQAWSEALNGSTVFETVRKPGMADVIVSFHRTLGSKGAEYGGFTRWERRVIRSEGTASWSLHADLQLRTHQPNGAPMTQPQLKQAALHELGHVLGLDDSTTSGEVMGPLNLTAPVTYPNTSEVEVLLNLRRLADRLRASGQASR